MRKLTVTLVFKIVDSWGVACQKYLPSLSFIMFVINPGVLLCFGGAVLLSVVRFGPYMRSRSARAAEIICVVEFQYRVLYTQAIG